MKMVIDYLNFTFHIEVKAKSNNKILNFIVQFYENPKWHSAFTDSIFHPNLTFDVYLCLMKCAGSSTFKQIWYFF